MECFFILFLAIFNSQHLSLDLKKKSLQVNLPGGNYYLQASYFLTDRNPILPAHLFLPFTPTLQAA